MHYCLTSNFFKVVNDHFAMLLVFSRFRMQLICALASEREAMLVTALLELTAAAVLSTTLTALIVLA